MLTFLNKKSSASGFTLVEILVVMLVIGLSLGMISRLDYSSGPQKLKNEASEFANTAALILEEAILSGDFWGIDLYTQTVENGSVYGYRWLHRQNEVWQEDMPAGMGDFAAGQLLDAEFLIQLEIEGLTLDLDRKIDLQDAALIPEDFAPEIWLYPNHETTAFSATFVNNKNNGESGRTSDRIIVASDILGRIRLVTMQGDS